MSTCIVQASTNNGHFTLEDFCDSFVKPILNAERQKSSEHMYSIHICKC